MASRIIKGHPTNFHQCPAINNVCPPIYWVAHHSVTNVNFSSLFLMGLWMEYRERFIHILLGDVNVSRVIYVAKVESPRLGGRNLKCRDKYCGCHRVLWYPAQHHSPGSTNEALIRSPARGQRHCPGKNKIKLDIYCQINCLHHGFGSVSFFLMATLNLNIESSKF